MDTFENTWSGTIGHVGWSALDGRTIKQIDVDLKHGQLPLMAVEPGEDPLVTKIAGRIDAVCLRLGDVIGSGWTNLEPGQYEVGLTLSQVSQDGDDEQSVCGTLVAVMVHATGSGHAAWSDCRITVEAGS